MPTYRIITSADKETVKEAIERLRDGVRFDVKIVRRRPGRSLPQNRTYWMWIGCIHEETGNDRDALHELFKRKFLGMEVLDVCGERVERPRSTKTLTTADFSAYMEKVQAWAAAEAGIRLPQPGDWGWEEFYERYAEYYG